MTREEAIKLLTESIKWFKPYTSVAEEWEKAMNMAIEALQAEANNDDVIIRGAKGIQDGLYNIKDGKLSKYYAKGGFVQEYEIVPSAEVQAEWISNHDGSWNCSECGLRVFIYAKGNYFPNCGSRMIGGEDE